MLLEIEESRVGDVIVFKMTGKLAMGRESQGVDSMTEQLARDGDKKVIFDITGVKYMDSAAIGMLASTARRLNNAGGKLVLVSSRDGRTTQLLKLTQVSEIVSMCTTMDEALAAVR